MPQIATALLESCPRAIVGTGRKSIVITLINKMLVIDKLMRNRFGVILPVGGDMHDSPAFEAAPTQFAKLLVHNTSFVMTFLVPGVREKQ